MLVGVCEPIETGACPSEKNPVMFSKPVSRSDMSQSPLHFRALPTTRPSDFPRSRLLDNHMQTRFADWLLLRLA